MAYTKRCITGWCYHKRRGWCSQDCIIDGVPCKDRQRPVGLEDKPINKKRDTKNEKEN